MSSIITVLGSYVCQMSAYLPYVPKPGETIIAKQFDMGPGGKGNNVAIGISRLGGEVLLVERVGDDIFGDLVFDTYQKENIDFSCVIRDKLVQSGIGLVYIQPSGENTAAYYAGANERLTEEDIYAVEDQIAKSSILYIQLEIPDAPILAAIDIAHKNNIKVVLNPAPAREVPKDIFSRVDIITPNQVEAMHFAGLPFREELTEEDIKLIGKKLISLGPSEVYLTLGKKGAHYFNRDEEVLFQKGINVNAIDTVGAGDAFNAALCFGYAKGLPTKEILQLASIVGGLTTTKKGVIDALPYMIDIDVYLKNKNR
jgi:ribokinase